MTDADSDEAPEPSSYSTILEEVEKTCREAGFETKWDEHPEDEGGTDLLLAIANGRYTRWIPIRDHAATIIASEGIVPVTALGDYEAFLYRDTFEIEAGLRTLSPLLGPSIATPLVRLPGAMVTEPDGETPDEGIKTRYLRPGQRLRLMLNSETSQTWSAEIGTASNRFAMFTYVSPRSRLMTLKLSGTRKVQRHDEALQLLEEVADAILFEMDLRYSQSMALASLSSIERMRRVSGDGTPEPRMRRRREVSAEKPSLPRNSYPAKPLALYWYARSAENMPLLQYLAFYQVLEYYFTTYHHREILDRMKQELLDPRFSPQNDSDLGKLFNLATSQGKGYASEREQLKATVRACVSAESLGEYLGDTDRLAFFSGKQEIGGIPAIELKNKQIDLRDQASDRIYDIRCRIVHAKSDTRDQYPELILPFSKEANSLTFDIELVQYLAQRLLINRAQPLRVS